MNRENTIRIIDVKPSDQLLLKKIKETYTDSFPLEERRDYDKLIYLFEHSHTMHIYVCQTATLEYAGFITCWRFEKFSFIEHFAINSEARNGGIGSLFLKEVLRIQGKPVILEAEEPLNDLCKRRIAFYERNGFVQGYVPYFQPPYRKGEPTIPMILMSYGNINLENEYQAIVPTIYSEVYNYEVE
ncbi:MAG: GNAT family N-acetyltransferase [Tannerellaceae bacterium]